MSFYTRVARKARRELLGRTARLRNTARAAVIGCGQIGPAHVAGYQESGSARAVAISDVRSTALASTMAHSPEVRGFRDYREMLESAKPDLVSICTWPQHHLEILQRVVEYPVKGVLCEKPMALQMFEVEEMLKICDRAGVKLGIGHQYRFHPYFRHAAELVAGGQIGRIVKLRGNIQDSVVNNGPHLLDTIRFLLGDRPATRVSAMIDGFAQHENRGFPAEAGAQGELVFDDGVVAEVSFGKFSPTIFDIELKGERASLRVDLHGVWLNGNKLATVDSDTAWYWCRRRQFAEFVEWVYGRRASYAANGQTSAHSSELVLAVYEAGRTQTPAELPLIHKGDVIHAFLRESTTGDAEGIAPAPDIRSAPRPHPIPHHPRLAIDGGQRAVSGWPNGHPHFGLAEFKGLGRVMLSKQLNFAGGTEVVALEKEFATLYGAPKAVASTSGTAAIHVAIAAINPEPGDEIITTAMTDMGTVVPILLANCVPVFADIDPITGNLTAETIASRITPRTRAVIVVHLFGRPANLAPIQALLRSRGIALIEDCAQAHFAEYQDKLVGTFGDLGCFSLQQSKQITCGDGGLTLVNRTDLIERASLFVDKGRSRKAGRVHLFLGANYRMTELQGAVARAQLRKGPALIAARRKAATALTGALRHLSAVQVPPDEAGTRPSWWLYNFVIDEARLGVDADEFCSALRAEGAPATRNYLPRPLFEEELITKRRTYGQSGYPLNLAEYVQPKREDFPGLEEFLRRQIILAWNSRIDRAHVEGVARALAKLLDAVSPSAAYDVAAGQRYRGFSVEDRT